MTRQRGPVLSLGVVAIGMAGVACGGSGPPPVTIDPPGKPEPVKDWLLCECSGCTLNGVGNATQVVPSCINEECGGSADFAAVCATVCDRWGFTACASTQPVANGCMTDSCATCLGTGCSAGSCFTRADVCQRTCTTDGSEPCSRCELCDGEEQICTLPPEGNQCVLPGARRMALMASSPMAAAESSGSGYLGYLHGRLSIALDEAESGFSFSHEDARGGSSLTNARLELVARECPGPDCALRVSSFSSTAADFTAVVDGADDQRVTGIQIFMQHPAGLAVQGDTGFVLPRFGMQLIMGYSVGGRHLIDAKNTADTDGMLDFDTGAFELSSSFPSAGATISLSLRGSVENFPPVANAGSDALAECTSPSGALVTLDGSGSSDRAPGPGLASYSWLEGFDPESGAGFSVATGAAPAVQLGKGPHLLTLVAQDGSGALDLDDVAIDVLDRTAPQPSCAGETKECTGPLTEVVTTCSAVDACDVEPLVSSDAEPAYPVGTHSFTCSASDDEGNSASAACEVVVTDTTPPVIQPSGTGQITACHGDPQVFDIPFPVVSDLCSASVVIGELVSVGGRTLDAAVPVPDSGQLLLPAGVFTIRWSAMDEHGNQSALDQTFSVQIVESASCCGAGQTLVEGTAGHDNLHLKETADYCVFALAGKDVVKTQDGNDHLFGGSGDDVLQCGGGIDSVFGGAGADTINSSKPGHLVVHGGPANDVIQAGSATTALLWAGLGDDSVQGGHGSDTIYPGAGQDVINGHAGDDTIVLFDACEAVQGKVLQGGPGRDTLVTPVSLADLLERGVVVNGFEVVVVDHSKAYLSECF
jgi:hypothetical protein